MQPYLILAKNAFVIQTTGNWQNTHGVSEQAVKKMELEWEPFSERQQTAQFLGSVDPAPSEWVTALLSAS
jgi:hypothetical protein